MNTNISKLNEVINEIKTSIEGIEGIGIVSPDGLIIVSSFSNEAVDEEQIAAYTASFLSGSEKTMQYFNKGVPEIFIVKSKEGLVIASSVGENVGYIIIVTNEKVKLGMLMIMMKTLRNKISNILQ